MRWSTVGWKELSGSVRKVGGWCLGARVGNFRLRLGSVVDSCKKVKSGGVPDVTPLMVKSVWLSICDLPAP
ncbi:hypothetical protein B296_00040551 [Ensete ventricosum]|uniref:Uncharacterized protein n=1 Tax=Ensete ventricosum TaxID=4639 RepID=A0A426YBH5_ENSVE|nr:hypothetical protein B296_00040551 [Ensete ventricosum]